jgi:5'-3' exonuclease
MAARHGGDGSGAAAERGELPAMACDWLLVDGSSLIFRAFHGVPQSVRAGDGAPVNAVRGFLDTLARLVTRRRPARIAVADDADWRPAWRVELIPGYKAHRVAEPVPAALAPQLPLIREVLAAIGVEMVGREGCEAEDLISTWTALADGRVEVVSGDRDLFALVEDPRVLVLYPERSGLTEVDEAEITRRYGIPGRRYADFAVLRGDPSDGLPGLRGVGAATAAALLRRYGDLGGVAAGAGLGGAERDYLSRAQRVVRPVRDLPVRLPAGRRDAYPADPPAVAELGERLRVAEACGRLVSALGGMGPTPPAPPGASPGTGWGSAGARHPAGPRRHGVPSGRVPFGPGGDAPKDGELALWCLPVAWEAWSE